MKTILKYLKGFKYQDIMYGDGTPDIKVYSNSDYMRAKKSKKFIFGYIFILNRGLSVSIHKSWQ